MAVPKKRTSRTRKLLRRGQWKLEIRAQALKALSLAAQYTTKRNTGENLSDVSNSNNENQ